MIVHEKKNNWTVYVHINKINQKCYVGITSKKPELRWGNGEGYKKQHFYKIIQKYGWDNFEHEIIAEHLTEQEAKNFEIKLIELLNSHISKEGYNISLGGDGYLGANNIGRNNPMYGKHHSKETKRKISIALKGKPSPTRGVSLSEETKRKMRLNHTDVSGKNNYWYKKVNQNMLQAAIEKNSKSVLQYDLDLNFISKYKSASEASRIVGVNVHAISSCCLHKSKTAKGYIWVFEDDLGYIESIKSNLDKYFNNKNIETCGKPVCQFNTNYVLINEYPTIHQASKLTNISRNSISKCCNHKQKNAGGYIWRFKEDSITYDNVNLNRKGKIVYKILNNKIIEKYSSIAEASKATNISRTSIGKACRGVQSVAGGYIWKYKEDVEEPT